MALRCLVVDFNSYFASVEQEMDPSLRGKPVAVVPMLADSTCCIAASYEAKAFGVKTGTRVGDAKVMCPGIRLVEARHERYVEFHHRLVEAVESCIHVDEVMSIDEMACALPRNWRTRTKALEVAQEIKRSIARKVGPRLRCSIGIAPNRFLAKTASDMQKPDGLVLLDEDDLPQRLYNLELRDLCGIGPNMEVRLHRAGIRTVRQLCAAGREELRRVWGGVQGERFYEMLRGEDVHVEPTRHTTIGHSHVLPPDQRSPEQALAVLHRLLQKAATRLRKMEYYAGGLHLALKYPDQGRWSADMRFQETQDTLHLVRVLGALWQRRPDPERKVLAVGVTLFRLLSAGNVTPSLFERAERLDRLGHLVDSINRQFGKNSVFLGGSMEALDAAPMRIAFHHIPDLETESDA
jgi:DNA polymerase-4